MSNADLGPRTTRLFLATVALASTAIVVAGAVAIVCLGGDPATLSRVLGGGAGVGAGAWAVARALLAG